MIRRPGQLLHNHTIVASGEEKGQAELLDLLLGANSEPLTNQKPSLAKQKIVLHNLLDKDWVRRRVIARSRSCSSLR